MTPINDSRVKHLLYADGHKAYDMRSARRKGDLAFATVLTEETMSKNLASPTPAQNHLLAALPVADYERLQADLERVPLPLGMAGYESSGPLEYVYFTTDCIVSLLYVMKSGASAEIAAVAYEGLGGVALFLGGGSTPSRELVESPGYAYRRP